MFIPLFNRCKTFSLSLYKVPFGFQRAFPWRLEVYTGNECVIKRTDLTYPFLKFNFFYSFSFSLFLAENGERGRRRKEKGKGKHRVSSIEHGAVIQLIWIWIG